MEYKAFKYRLYPTKKQEILLDKAFGCVRYVYNRGLEFKMALYNNEKRGISVFDLMKEMALWKKEKETIWLKETSSLALQASLINLDHAYTNFFRKKNEFPKFKSKGNNQSFCNPQNTTVDWINSKICFPKFKDGITAVLHRSFAGNIKSSVVSKTLSGKYFISILVELKTNPNLKHEVLTESKSLGIDLGIKNFATFSDGTVVQNPRHFQKKQKALKRAQKKLSRKKKGSHNRNKQQRKIAVLYEKVTNSRKDFLHKVTHKLVENQDYSSLAIEDLNVAEMLKKGKKNKLSHHIADAGWGMFRQFLTYKCERARKNLLVIGRFEPSSKLCSCGYLNSSLTLKEREWDCPECKSHHKRDELAAQNIKRFAFCKQNTKKDLIRQELPKFTPLETCVSKSSKKELPVPMG